MTPLADALALVATHIRALPPQRVPLAASLGRTLRESVSAEEDLPGFHRSAFDGYALRAAETPGTLRVAAEIAAGAAEPGTVQPGECARIFTGGELPRGADTIAMQEHCTREGGSVKVPRIEPGHGVRQRGEDARAGSVLLPRGTRLGAVEASLLAQLGHTQPLISPKPRILHIVTGSELVPPDQTPPRGKIRDSNSSLIAALAAQAGCELVAQGRVTDELPTLLAALGSVEEFDLLLLSGGASVGDYDFGLRALGELGFGAHFTQLDQRPGKPLIFATRGRQTAFVLPGNPLSHLVCWYTVIRPALAVMAGGTAELALEQATLGAALRGNARPTWWPARLSGAHAEPLKWQSSGDITGLAAMNALIQVPTAGLEKGAVARVLRL